MDIKDPLKVVIVQFPVPREPVLRQPGPGDTSKDSTLLWPIDDPQSIDLTTEY